MIELFSNCETTTYFDRKIDEIKSKINNFSDEEILCMNFNEWINYFLDEYKIQPITLFIENISRDISSTKVKPPNSSYRISINEYESGLYDIDGYKVTFNIPFDGNTELLYLKPSKWFLSKFFVENILYNNNDNYHFIVFTFSDTKQELESKKNEDYIDNKFNQIFKDYIKTINNINYDTEQYNAKLEPFISKCLDNRKKKADDLIDIGKKFNIPLKQNPNAPNITPVLLKKVPIKKPIIPEMKKPEEEYQILSSDYDYIKRIIQFSGSSMEKAAKTFSKLEEEELRDIIIAFLNSHYLPTATAETFSKIGKTDIHILFDNKAAYIAECKIWHGEKKFQEAIEQLFGYITWRDIKTSLIIFNKENKDFIKLLNTIKTSLDNFSACKIITQNKKNEWLCEFKKGDENTTNILVQIIIFDLCIN